LIEDSNALILPAKADKAAAAADGTNPESAPPPEKHLSKSQLRKLRRIQEEKEKREKRADVLQTLARHQVRQRGAKAGGSGPPLRAELAALGCQAMTTLLPCCRSSSRRSCSCCDLSRHEVSGKQRSRR
jgi:hypothetical protein